MKKNIWISESRNSREYSSRFLENIKITGNRCIGGNNYMMSVISENAAKGVSVPEAGQFYMFQLKNQIRILRRPISIHNIDYKTGKLEFLYIVFSNSSSNSLYSNNIILPPKRKRFKNLQQHNHISIYPIL